MTYIPLLTTTSGWLMIYVAINTAIEAGRQTRITRQGSKHNTINAYLMATVGGGLISLGSMLQCN
jgi:uncharacterized membrane protein YraQ (UPF0718 family)